MSTFHYRNRWAYITILLIHFGCNNVPKEEADNNIQGMYVAKWSNEYSSAVDTIDIYKTNGSTCFLNRKTLYQKKTNHVTSKPEYKLQKWTGEWNKVSGTITVNGNGRIITVNKNELSMGSTVYRKIGY